MDDGLSDWLASAFGQGRVTQVRFTRLTKAQLGAGSLAMVETGRFQYWLGEPGSPGDKEQVTPDGWWFWQQCGHCIYEIKPGGTWERDLAWEVPASAKADTPIGPQPVHDDRLVSAALVSMYDELVLEGLLRTGQGKAAVIRGRDALEGMEF